MGQTVPMATVARRWTITTWNILGADRPDITDLSDRLRDEAPDVIVLQEVRKRQAAEISEQLGMHHAWAFKHYPYSPVMRHLAEGLAIITPHRIDAPGSVSLSPNTSKWTYRHRIAQWALIERDDHSAFRVVNIHLSPRDDANSRAAEAQRVAALVAGGGAPAIVAGDFNDHDDHNVIESLPGAEYIDSPPTNPSDAPVKRLDHVLLPDGASDQLSVISSTVPDGGSQWRTRSDHLPLTVKFEMDWVTADFPVDAG